MLRQELSNGFLQVLEAGLRDQLRDSDNLIRNLGNTRGHYCEGQMCGLSQKRLKEEGNDIDL